MCITPCPRPHYMLCHLILIETYKDSANGSGKLRLLVVSAYLLESLNFTCKNKFYKKRMHLTLFLILSTSAHWLWPIRCVKSTCHNDTYIFK